MNKEEYKIICKFLNRVIGDVKKELKESSADFIVDCELLKGGQKYMIRYLKEYKQWIKEDVY